MKRVIAAASAAGNRRRSSQRFLGWLLALLCLSAAALVLVHLRPDTAVSNYVLQHSRTAARVQPAADNTSSTSAGEMDDAVNVNTAGVDELCTIPGVGPALARAIIDERLNHGFFYYPEDLLCVRGIGEKTIVKLLPYMKLK